MLHLTEAAVDRRIDWAMVTSPVEWTSRHGDNTQRNATFVSAWMGADLMDVRLVRVEVGTAWFNRRMCEVADQPVETWEAEAATALRSEVSP